MTKKPTSLWGQRAATAGLSQQELATLLGVAVSSVGRGLRGEFSGGVPAYLKCTVIAWEMMTPDQRQRWLNTCQAETTGNKEAELPLRPRAS